jgi:subtilisin family serine protease
MRSPFLISAVVVAAALAAGSSAVRADLSGLTAAEPVCELVVYVGSEVADLSVVRTACALATGKTAPDEEKEITSSAGDKGRILVYRMGGWNDVKGRSAASRIRGTQWVTDVLVNGFSRTQGAPSTIPILDGDLAPRVIRDQPAMGQVRLPPDGTYGTGAGVLVAVLDGGFDLRHEVLVGRLHPARWDALEKDTDPQDTGNGFDDDGDGILDSLVGHGTFAASLILAEAPGATILPIRCLDDEGWGTPLAVAEGIQRAIDSGARVINMSLVIPTTTPMIRDAVSAATDAGIIVVSSAGNGGASTWQNDPQLSQRVITVGAVDADDRKASFSTTGLFVHVYAPGVSIRGALGGVRPNEYARWDGTSFAAPIVSGIAALARGKSPSVTTQTLRDAMMATVAPAADVTPQFRGRVDAAATLNAVAR